MSLRPPCKVVSLVRARAPRALAIASLLVAASSAVAQESGSSDRPGPRRGDLELVIRNRLPLVPERVVSGLKLEPTIGVRWMALDRVRLSLDAQTVDNSGPGRQGSYSASRTLATTQNSGNFVQEVALEGRLSLWGRPGAPYELSLTSAISRGVRSYTLRDPGGAVVESGNRRQIVPSGSLELASAGERGRVGLALSAAFLPERDALYLRALPGSGDRFGRVLGPELAGESRLLAPLSIWGRAFVPVTGRNSIARGTGRAVRVPTYDAGARLHLNPALDVDLFASNALGNTGALAYVGDHEYAAVGTGVTFRPGARFRDPLLARASRDAMVASLAINSPSLSASTLPRGHGLVRVAGGAQGVLAAIEFSPVEALSVGSFLDYTAGLVDEGELGVTGRIRLLDQAQGSPVTVGVLMAASRTNNPLINLLTGRRDELQRLGLGRGDFRPGRENAAEGRLYVLTGALPVEAWLADVVRARLAPVVGYVERRGVQVAGLVGGVEGPLSRNVAAGLDLGWDIDGKGNTLTSAGRVHELAYRAALSWRPEALGSVVVLDAYVTNRVGDSPFHSLRVRESRRAALGLGAHVAF